MKTFKKILAVVLVILSLSGCASSAKRMTDSSENETTANTDILIHQGISIDDETTIVTESATEPSDVTEPVTESTEVVIEPATESTEPSQPSEPTQPVQPTEPKPTEPKPTNPTEPPHTHSYTGTVTKSPTCTASGTKTYTCSCGASYTETIPALGHSWGSWTQTVAPTCEAKGTEQRSCSRCGKTETRDAAALGHKWDNGTVTTQPTCSNTGVRTYHCKRTGCSKTKTEVIPATGNHSWKQTQAPTCTNNGTETCSVCHKTRSVNALGHDWEYHPAETETVYVYACYCGARFYSVTDWEAHQDSYLDTDEEDNHGGFQTWSEEHVIKPAYNKCKRCGMENPA